MMINLDDQNQERSRYVLVLDRGSRMDGGAKWTSLHHALHRFGLICNVINGIIIVINIIIMIIIIVRLMTIIIIESRNMGKLFVGQARMIVWSSYGGVISAQTIFSRPFTFSFIPIPHL